MKDPSERVAIVIVTHESERDIGECLEAALRTRHRPLEIVVVDCGSRDASVDGARQALAAAAGERVTTRLLPLVANRGFTGGMNEGITSADADWILSLNPDARITPDFVSALLARAEASPGIRCGAVTGRLIRPRSGKGGGDRMPRLDACGMRLSPAWRHFDRGSGEPDNDRFHEAARVFGATGAATLWRREALVDVAVDGEFFLEEFHTYREDAELCFRLRERGWEIVYEPGAIAEHRRRNLPSRRRRMPPEINRASLRNRYLLRAYHHTGLNFLLTLPFALFRDLTALAWVLAVERTSLGAYTWLWRNRGRVFQRRRRIQERRTVGSTAVDRWFFREEDSL